MIGSWGELFGGRIIRVAFKPPEKANYDNDTFDYAIQRFGKLSKLITFVSIFFRGAV